MQVWIEGLRGLMALVIHPKLDQCLGQRPYGVSAQFELFTASIPRTCKCILIGKALNYLFKSNAIAPSDCTDHVSTRRELLSRLI